MEMLGSVLPLCLRGLLMAVVLRNRAIHPDDWGLLDAAAERYSLEEADTEPFTRYGRSAARLFLLRGAGGNPLLVKTDACSKIAAEFEASRRVRRYFADAWQIDHLNANFGDRDGLVFTLHGENDGEVEVVELADGYKKALAGGSGAEADLERLLSNLKAVYEHNALHAKAQQRSRPRGCDKYGAYFERYVDRSGHPDRLGEMFRSLGEPFDAYGERVTNPLGALDELMQTTALIPPVDASHGDLHLNNVVLSTDRPHLIDFAWSAIDDHLLKDFVMMESSARFMLFPRHVHPNTLARVDRALNARLIVDDVAACLTSSTEETLRWAAYVMACFVAEVRKQAWHAAEALSHQLEPFEREYFRCLYLVLAGQQRFATFPLVRLAWNLQTLQNAYV